MTTWLITESPEGEPRSRRLTDAEAEQFLASRVPSAPLTEKGTDDIISRALNHTLESESENQ